MYRPYGREVEYAKYFDAAQVVFESLGESLLFRFILNKFL